MREIGEFKPRYDKLTGLLEREDFYKIVDNFIEFQATTFALLMLDLDAFKDVNDDKGHIEGDKQLEIVGEILRDLRGVTPARRDGDEFFVLLPNITDPMQLNAVMERIRVLFAGRDIKASISGKVHSKDETRVELERAVDAELGVAKIANVRAEFTHKELEEFERSFEVFDSTNATPSQIARLYRDYLRKKREYTPPDQYTLFDI